MFACDACLRLQSHKASHSAILVARTGAAALDASTDIRLAGLYWLGEGDDEISGSSSEEDEPDEMWSRPPCPLPPSLHRDTEMVATWDLLIRPDGFSIRRVFRTFLARHGMPNEFWLPNLLSAPAFVVFAPRVASRAGDRAGGLLPPLLDSGWRGGVDPRAALDMPLLYVRRGPLPAVPLPRAVPSARLQAAATAVFQDALDEGGSNAARALLHAGAARIPSAEQYRVADPAPFAQQRLDRRPDAECLITPMPRCNVALVRPNELEPPADQPDLVAHSFSDVVTAKGMARIKRFRRAERRMWTLASKGMHKAARNAKPADLTLEWAMHTRPRFRGVVMDFESLPFRSLQPSRWPDRPPSTDLHIRAFRREFRSHPSFTNRQLRGVLSHGTPAWNECARISHLAGPHGSTLKHMDQFERLRSVELEKEWARVGFGRSLECATWPVRQVPSSIAFRSDGTKPRLCTDLSWPPPGVADGVDSPNDAQRLVVDAVEFIRLVYFCVMCAVMLVAGVEIRVWKLDLVACYKRAPQQTATRWYRQYSTMDGTQTLDRVSFGQTDGPSSCTEQTNFVRFIIVREIRYADACYPTRDVAILAYLESRRDCFGADDGAELSLAQLLVMLDDFGGVSFDDLLWRADGTPFCDRHQAQRRRAQLHFEVAVSVITRLGHDVDPSSPDKYVPPTLVMVLIGGRVDVGPAESLSLEPAKRTRYKLLLEQRLRAVCINPTELTSLAFKMLVVCEVYPLGRQWLHSAFRCLRRHRHALSILWADEPEVASDMERFWTLLSSASPLAIPLACRRSFPFDGHPHLIVKYDDASGLSAPGAEPEGEPGFGAWTVRDHCLFYIHGLWTEEEARLLSISVLEYLISLFSTDAFSALQPLATHMLEFTDNSGVEWSARRENARSELMQRVTSRRSHLLSERRLFARTARVPSTCNTWADDLSRQRVEKVLREAAALGLRVCRVELTNARDTEWLLGHARRIAGARQQA